MSRIKVFDPVTQTWVHADMALGQTGPEGPAGPQGPAYSLTAADKTAIAAEVKSSLPTLTVTGIDADGVSHSWTMYGVAK